MGSIAIYSWSSVKSKAYASNTERHTYSSGDILIPYEKFMDKYLGGENGYGLRRDNEDYYYSITNGNVLRPLKAVLAIFNSKTQFYVGREESLPLVSFYLLWIIYCTIIYLIIYGIKIARQRANN